MTLIPTIPAFTGWALMVTPEGVWVAPVYSGRFGCRLYHQETLGL